MLAYLVVCEKNKQDDAELERFKQALIAAHPEFANEIIEDFDSAKVGEYADPDDIEERPMDANSLEAALEQMAELGIGLSG